MKQHQQGPLLNVVPGDDTTVEKQEVAAWSVMAEACEEALTLLGPHHPRRVDFVEMWTDCRRAAGLPLEPDLSLSA